MAEDEKKPSSRFAGWKTAVESNDAAVGGSEAVLRKAIALNPQMTGGLSEDEFIRKMAGMQQEAAEAKAKAPGPAADKPIDLLGTGTTANKLPEAASLVDLLRDLKAWVTAEHARIDAERQIIAQAETQALKGRAEVTKETVASVVDLVARLDPHMTSPKTQLLLSDETQFLKEIGFKPDLVKERMRANR